MEKDFLLEKKKIAAKRSSIETKDELGKLITVPAKLFDKPRDKDKALCQKSSVGLSTQPANCSQHEHLFTGDVQGLGK